MLYRPNVFVRFHRLSLSEVATSAECRDKFLQPYSSEILPYSSFRYKLALYSNLPEETEHFLEGFKNHEGICALGSPAGSRVVGDAHLPKGEPFFPRAVDDFRLNHGTSG